MVTRGGPSTVFVGQYDHPFVQRTTEILRCRCPNLVIRKTEGLWLPARTTGRVVLHLQWIDAALRQRSLLGAVKSTLVLISYVLALRLLGVRTVWTIHNPVCKGHNRRQLDRALRTALTATCSQFIVLNEGAVGITEEDLHPAVRSRFRQRVHCVPMPMAMNNHGDVMSTDDARTRLAIGPKVPLLVYLAGHNQADRSADLRDPLGRYELISLHRDGNGDGASGLHRVAGGWEFRGRPSDEEYGLLISSGDAVVMAEDSAFGSMTLHTAVELRRPVISVPCPAAEGLEALGGAAWIQDELCPDSVWSAWERLDLHSAHVAFRAFEERHSDEHVAGSLGAAYQAAGLELK